MIHYNSLSLQIIDYVLKLRTINTKDNQSTVIHTTAVLLLRN